MATISAEWIKLRTVRSHWVLAIIAVAFPIVVTSLVSMFADFDMSDTISLDLAELIGGLIIVTAMLLGSMTSISLTSEFAHNTIRPTYAATPKRLRVHGAKLAVTTGAVVATSVASIAVSWLISTIVLSSRGYDLSVTADGVVPMLLALIALCAIVGWFGYGLGLLIRNSPGTVTLFLLWPLLLESLIGLVFQLIGWDGAVKWLPYAAAISAAVDPSADEILGRPGGLVWFATVVAALIALGLTLDSRRDA